MALFHIACHGYRQHPSEDEFEVLAGMLNAYFAAAPNLEDGSAKSDRPLAPHTASVAAPHQVSATAATHLHHSVHVVALRTGNHMLDLTVRSDLSRTPRCRTHAGPARQPPTRSDAGERTAPSPAGQMTGRGHLGAIPLTVFPAVFISRFRLPEIGRRSKRVERESGLDAPTDIDQLHQRNHLRGADLRAFRGAATLVLFPRAPPSAHLPCRRSGCRCRLTWRGCRHCSWSRFRRESCCVSPSPGHKENV
jgi:hypothetical protein